MKEKSACLTISGGIEVFIERKKVKNIRLKVYPDGVVKLSAPPYVSDEWIGDYLHNKVKWIEKTIAFFKNTEASKIETGIFSGVSTRILGRQIRIIINETKTRKIEREDNYIYIQSPAAGDKHALQKQLERWWRKHSKCYFLTVIDKLYPIISIHGIEKPALRVRKMKTLWGSCSKKHGRINLNYYLYKAPPPCIEYVILHELTHFLYSKHNKDFYEFLTVHMPDWKERKRILDYEIVKELGY